MRMGKAQFLVRITINVPFMSSATEEQQRAQLRLITERLCSVEPDNRRDKQRPAIGQVLLHPQVQCMAHLPLHQ